MRKSGSPIRCERGALKTNRRGTPLTRCDETMTEAAFWGFIRRVLRRASIKWNPRALAKLASRRKNQSDNRRLKWEYQCSNCRLWYPDKHVVVDHIIPCGSLTCADDLPGFVTRMFCEKEGFRVLCIDCDQDREWESNGEKETSEEGDEENCG